MNFELILVLATVITGLLVLLDRMVWKKKRDQSAVTQNVPVLIEYARSLFPVFLIVLVLRSFIIEPFRIPSGSMYPTLEIGDFIVVNKYSYGVRLPVLQSRVIPLGNPERGDVAVFRYPLDPNVDYIKRIIGVPGDRIAYIDKVLYLNGEPLPQEALGRYIGLNSGSVMTGARHLRETLPDGRSYEILIDQDRRGMNIYDVVVPEGYYFAIGDNRDHSADSRSWGLVSEEFLKGRAFAIWMNWDQGLQWSRIGRGIE